MRVANGLSQLTQALDRCFEHSERLPCDLGSFFNRYLMPFTRLDSISFDHFT